MAGKWVKGLAARPPWVGMLLFLSLSASCCAPCTLAGQTRRATATITGVSLATAVSSDGSPIDNVTRFDPSVPRIWCVITSVSNAPFPMGVRWYYRDQLIAHYRFQVDRSPASVALPAPEQGYFAEGEYRVEVYFVQKPEWVVRFTVGG